MQRKTASSRFGRALQRVAAWCRKARHLPVREQWKTLAAKLRGHYAYFGITGNSRALGRFVYEVKRVWRKWLHRRSNRVELTRFSGQVDYAARSSSSCSSYLCS